MVLGHSHESKPFSVGGPDFSDYAGRQVIRIAGSKPKSNALISDYSRTLGVMVELAPSVTGRLVPIS